MNNVENYLVDVPYKRNGKSARFYNDRVEFKKKSIRYDDIAILIASCGTTTIHTYCGIPVGRSYDGAVVFKMNDGKTHGINLNSMSLFGISFIRNPRKSEKLFPPLFNAVHSIVAWNMAQRYVDAIMRGGTVEVCGLTINSLEAKSIKKSGKNTVVINKENYRESQIPNGSDVIVYDKSGERLWNSSIWSYKNNLLIPYILDTIFGN
ncbi:hypothetical protein [Anaerosporobacter sp.]